MHFCQFLEQKSNRICSGSDGAGVKVYEAQEDAVFIWGQKTSHPPQKK